MLAFGGGKTSTGTWGFMQSVRGFQPPGAALSLKSRGKLSPTLIRFGLGLSSHVKDTCVIKPAAAERSVS